MTPVDVAPAIGKERGFLRSRQGYAWLAALTCAVVLVMHGWPLAGAAVLGVTALAPATRWLVSWRTMLAVVILSVLFIPANLYSLPASLPIDVEIYRLLVFSLFLVWFVALLTDPEVKLRRTFLDAHMLAVASAVILSFAVNLREFEPVLEFEESEKAMLYVLTFIVLYYCIVSIVRDNRLSMRLLNMIVYMGAVLAVFGMFERVTRFNVFKHLHEFIPLLEPHYGIDNMLIRGGLRVSGSLTHPIAFGTLLAMIVPLPVVLLLDSDTVRQRLKWGFITLLITITALLTVSRTAFVGLVGVLAILAVTRPKQRTMLLACTVIVAVTVHMFFPGVIGRFIDTLTPSRVVERELSAGDNSRLADYPRVVAEFTRKPLVGRGVGTFTHERFFFVDNQYLKYLVETGLVGLCAELFLFIGSMVLLSRRGRQLGGHEGSMVSAVGASVLVYALVNATFDAQGFPQVPYTLFTLLGLAVATVLNAEKEPASAGVERPREVGST